MRFQSGFLAGALALAMPASLEERPPAAPDPRVARGGYIVEHVALCVQCHTPRDQDGQIIRSELLHGAAVPFKSPFPGRPWAVLAPNIAGMIGYTEESGVRLLTEGIARSGKPPLAPMPPFRMTREDAEAVVAFLKSVP